jgi:hypothetical protein
MPRLLFDLPNNRRLWRAHVAEIFPWLEEMRVYLIDQFRDDIKLPHVLQTEEVITDRAEYNINRYSTGLGR